MNQCEGESLHEMKGREKSAESLIYVTFECCRERDKELKAWQQSNQQQERHTVDNGVCQALEVPSFLCIYKPGTKQRTLDLTFLMSQALIGLDNKAGWSSSGLRVAKFKLQ